IELGDEQRPKISLLGIGELTDIWELESLVESSDIIVIEFFKIRPDKKDDFVYKDLHAPEAIGKVKMLCEKYKKQIEMQGADRKPMGFAWAGMRYVKGKKGTHQQDGLAHAVYFAVKNLHAVPLAR